MADLGKFDGNFEDFLELYKKVLNKEMTIKALCEELEINRRVYYQLKEKADEMLAEAEQPKELTPYEYFQDLKSRAQTVTSEDLLSSFQAAQNLMDAFEKSGQTKAQRKLNHLMDVIAKEQKLVDLGVDQFIYYQDLERYVGKVEKRTVKMIELKNYERPIPEEIQEVVEMVKDVFDELIVVFTDYTGTVEKQVEKERREKDPILFGYFTDGRHPLSDRFYFLGDWVDDYCDLTLESLITEMRELTGESIHHGVVTPTTEDSLRARLEGLTTKEDDQQNLSEEDFKEKYHDTEREYRVKNIGEKIVEKFKKVSTILKRKKS